MSKPECVGKKVLISGATPFDPENKIKPFKAAACEVTNGEYKVFEEGRAGSRFELVVTTQSGDIQTLPVATKDAMDKRAAEVAGNSGVKTVEKRLVVASTRPQLDAKLAGADQPVANVDARKAQSYCEAQLDENGNPGRLPTGKEWEKMARGPQGFGYGTADGTLKCGQNASCDADASAVVGSYEANGFGVYDSTGNVWEWTMESDGDTCIRGGAWINDDVWGVSAGSRGFGYGNPDSRNYFVGFRCVWPQDSKK